MVVNTVFGDHREKILSHFKKNASEIPEYITILRKWMEKQPHIPSDLLEDRVLEITIIKSKFSVEKAKKKLESYCTLKAKNEMKPYFDTSYELCVPSQQPSFYIPIPELTEKNYRVLVGNYRTLQNYDLMRDARNTSIFAELFLRHDYNAGEIVIFDFSEISMLEFLTHFRANIFADVVKLLLQAHAARVIQLHYYVRTAGISTLIGLMKPFLPAKISSRMIVHDNLESLKSHFSPDDLPKDYGGNQKSLKEILANLDLFYETHGEDLKKYASIKAREELREEGSVSDEMQGTFRKLGVD